MKKIFLSFATGTLLLTACTSQEVIDESIQSNAIGFENVINKPTRADVTGDPNKVLTKSNFDEFYVYGYYTKPGLSLNAIQIFNQEKVQLENGSWTYTNPRYWNPGATYYFYAYSCGDLKLSNKFGTFSMDISNDKSIDERALMINGYVCDHTHQHDLVYAEKEGMVGKDKSANEGEIANNKVNFQFRHLLSKVDAEFKSDFPEGYQIKVSNVQISNILNKASYNPKATQKKWYGHLSISEEDGTNPYIGLYINDKENIAENSKDTVRTGNGFAIPYDYNQQTGGNVTLTFSITVIRDGKEVLQRRLRGNFNPTWTEGHAYTYSITITGTDASLEAIAFETATDPITGWTNGGTSSITLETIPDSSTSNDEGNNEEPGLM